MYIMRGIIYFFLRLLLEHNVPNFVSELLYVLKTVTSHSLILFSFSFFFVQRLLNMHIYDNAMYANLEDLNA